MKKLIKEYKNVSRYYDEGIKDIFNKKVLVRYIIDNEGNEIKDGYIYKRTKREINKLKKEYGKDVGINEYIDCPIEYISNK